MLMIYPTNIGKEKSTMIDPNRVMIPTINNIF